MLISYANILRLSLMQKEVVLVMADSEWRVNLMCHARIPTLGPVHTFTCAHPTNYGAMSFYWPCYSQLFADMWQYLLAFQEMCSESTTTNSLLFLTLLCFFKLLQVHVNSLRGQFEKLLTPLQKELQVHFDIK